MPQLFDVPGWKVPDAPVTQSPQNRNPKKRKRPTSDGSSKLLSAEFSLEKLMDRLKDKTAEKAELSKRDKPKNKTKKEKKEKKKDKEKGKGKEKATANVVHKEISRPMPLKPADRMSKPKERSPATVESKAESSRPSKRRKTQHAATAEGSSRGHEPSASSETKVEGNLTELQRNMKQSLDGAKFRMINENLYKSESREAVQMMKEDPAVFSEYHKGFRRQVQSWPTNPVNIYIAQLQDYPARTVIADLGCGDAALAKALIPQGMAVLSFDLVSDGAFVIEADACQKLPLPGSEGSETGSSVGEGHVVDVVVCALSLMNTNWPRCVREAWRILKANGELKIAEVASRFTSVKEFENLVASIGFKLKSKDTSNTHFTLFEFRKIARQPKTEKEWNKIYAKNSLLKPCEYKRR